MRTIEIKIIQNEKSHSTIEGVMQQLIDIFNGKEVYRTIETSLKDLKRLKDKIKKDFDDAIKVRQGVSDGCYGARTGKQLKGITLWCDSSLFETRYIDGEFDEVVNIEQLCNEFGTLVGIDADEFETSMELLEIESKRDNTYNYMGHSSESPATLCNADFSVYSKDDDTQLVSIKFHCGGDPRGNYSQNVVYKFDSIEDMYSALFPSLQLLDECKIDEIEVLKEQLYSNPENRAEIVEKLNDLID